MTPEKKYSQASTEALLGLLSSLDAQIYVTDPETDRVLYINEKMKKQYGIEDGVGGLCYDVLWKGVSERCHFCPCHELDKDPDKTVIWERYSSYSNRYYIKADQYIDWPGVKKAHVQYTIDISKHKRKQDNLDTKEILTGALYQLSKMFLTNRNMPFVDIMAMGAEFIASVTGIDLLSVWRNDERPDGIYTNMIFRWGAESGGTDWSFPDAFRYVDDYPNWSAQFNQDRVVNSPVRLMSDYEGARMRKLGILSVFATPVFINGALWGAVHFYDRQKDRAFNEYESEMMRAAAILLVQTAIRVETDEHVKQQNDLLNSINRVAVSLLTSETEDNYEEALLESMDILGECIEVDRVQIWHNDTNGGSPHFILKNEWLSDFGREICNEVPIGTTFEYNESWLNSFNKERFYSGPVSLMSEGIRGVISRLDLKSVIIIPLFSKMNFLGVCLLGDCEKERFFSEDEISILRSAGLMLVSAIDRFEQSKLLRSALDMAERANRAKSSFLATVSHEIRTPMNAILGIAEIQIRDEDLPVETREGLVRIHDAGYVLLHIINDILDLSKIEAGKLEQRLNTYDIPSLINDTVHLNIIRLGSKDIDFRLEVDENIPTTLYGDELRIKQILNNLLSNAFKYTDSGVIKLTASVESVPDHSEIVLIFTVSDTGRGMTKEQTETMFEDYTRFDEGDEVLTEGVGLGMGIVQRLVRMMSGKISVESEPGVGTTFTVRLPQGSVGSSPIGRNLASNLQSFTFHGRSLLKGADISREYMPYGSVLVVDDVSSNLYVAKGFLQPYSVTIDTALSGFEAIEKIKSGIEYDVIFMDHMMPKMDGIETTAIIREMGYTKPIVALTANALVGQSDMFLASGFDDYISKPIDIRLFNICLNKYIRDRKDPQVVADARRQREEALAAVNAAKPDIDLPHLKDIVIRDTEKAVDLLERIHNNGYRRDNDIETITITVHSMKSALLNIGETALSNIALNLEKTGRAKDLAQLKEDLPSFIDALRILARAHREKDVSEDFEDEDPVYLRDKLIAIREACLSYDRKTAKEALNELNKMKWSKHTKKGLDAVSEHLLHGDYEDAAAAANGMCAD